MVPVCRRWRARPYSLVALLLVLALVLPPALRSGARQDDGVPILMYHVIGEPPLGAPYPGLFVSRAEFARQLLWLRASGYSAVTLSDLWRHWRYGTRLPMRPIILTFDDGHRSATTVALPLLRLHGWVGVLNLKVGSLPSVITARQVDALVAAGWEIGAHTLTHPSLPSLGDGALRREVAGSRRAIQKRFHTYVRFFCYPSGEYDLRVVEAVRDAGYAGATTTEQGLGRRSELYSLDRIRVSRGDGVSGLQAALRAAMR